MAGILRLLLTGAVACAANLAVYRRHTPDQPWTRLIAWERDRLFNGVEAVRFDYAAGSAYVSAAFGGDSDDIYLAIVDAAGQPVPAQFVEIPRYYDDRSAAVVVTGDDEMSGCSQDIKDSLAVPYPSGAAEYVAAYVDPGGYSDETLRAKLAQYRYLVERSIYQNVQDFAPWNADDGLYERVGVTLCGDHRSLLELDMAFYWARQQHGIYHLYIHPWLHDWSDGSPIRQHIDHIKGQSDLWYVGFGHLYLYRYVQERGQVTVTALPRQD